MVGGGGFAHLATQTHPYPNIPSLHPSHPSLLAPIASLRPNGGSGNSPKASRFVVIEWRRDEGKRDKSIGVSNSDPFRLCLRLQI
jgi:hypothetical protein